MALIDWHPWIPGADPEPFGWFRNPHTARRRVYVLCEHGRPQRTGYIEYVQA